MVVEDLFEVRLHGALHGFLPERRAQAIFLHTLVFKKILTNKEGAFLYQLAFPFTLYLSAGPSDM